MMRRIWLGGAVLLLTWGMVAAAVVQTSGPDDEAEEPDLYCPTIEGCECNTNWNPNVSCSSDSVDDIDDLLTCLVVSGSPGCSGGSGPSTVGSGPDPFGGPDPLQDLEMDSGGPDDGCVVPGDTGDYIVRKLDPPLIGIEILRIDGSEIDNVELFESFPGIGWTQLHVDREDLLARIRLFSEQSLGGRIEITLNYRALSVDTRYFRGASDLNQGVAEALRAAGFDARYEPPDILVHWDRVRDSGLKHVGLRTLDPGLVTSELALEPAPPQEPLTLSPQR